MTDIIASAHPFDPDALEALALYHDERAAHWPENHVIRHYALSAADLLRSTVRLHDELHERFLALSTEFHLSEYERAALKAEVLALRSALQQARDTRPNENYKVVTIELEKVDALLGKTFPLNPARDSSKL